MSSATVTSKGQVTIPAEVRSALGLRSGSRLMFVSTSPGVFEIRVQSASVRDLKGAVPRPRGPVSLDDMNEAIATETAEPAG